MSESNVYNPTESTSFARVVMPERGVVEPRVTSMEYRDREGFICPNCESSDNLERTGEELEGATYYVDWRCNICGSTWYDLYKLDGYDDLQVGVTDV